MSIIVDDLLITRSVDLTIDNILESRLVAPLQTIEEEPVISESASAVNNVEEFVNTPSTTK